MPGHSSLILTPVQCYAGIKRPLDEVEVVLSCPCLLDDIICSVNADPTYLAVAACLGLEMVEGQEGEDLGQGCFWERNRGSADFSILIFREAGTLKMLV